MAEWAWEPDDFAALWENDANDRFPFPLGYVSRFRTNGEVAAHRELVRGRYDADETELIQLAFHTLAAADLRIEIIGASTVLGEGELHEYRMVGARNAYHAVLLSQTVADGIEGTIRCRLFRPEQLPTRMARLLPAYPAGAGKPDTFHLDDLRAAAVPNEAAQRFQRKFDRPSAGGGSAVLRTGPLHGRPTPHNAVQWLDLVGDGRYLQLRTTEHVSVRPATPAAITACFAAWIDRRLRRLRADADETW
ncbi:ESX secretion-associated protein EspG [Nocardia sp. alder85J]|uniref:ESX secretion-associated protein EspG n=1 Tax=Nocardia sp. alder85J TaxID=2862949 RepID=UPI001CD69E42|nr:ESX secretion-associated protein EspG [Nocardia sp. alder85J]MCX4097098.1 ESX secretion-associated protein EspG [Nocardia sp. alder85J]